MYWPKQSNFHINREAAKTRLRIIGEEWPRCFRMPRQSPLRRTIGVRYADRQENIFSHGNTGELTWLEQGTAVPMIMAEQEVGLAAKHNLFTRLHRVGNQVKGTESIKQGMASDPRRKKHEGQRV